MSIHEYQSVTPEMLETSESAETAVEAGAQPETDVRQRVNSRVLDAIVRSEGNETTIILGWE